MDSLVPPINFVEVAEKLDKGETLEIGSADSQKEQLLKFSELLERWSKTKGQLIGLSVFDLLRSYCKYDGYVIQSCDVNNKNTYKSIRPHHGWVALKKNSLELLQDDPDRTLSLTSFYIDHSITPFHPANKPDESEMIRACPKCMMAMKKVNYAYDSNIIIDRCEKCAGIWTDKGELIAIAKFVKNDPRT